MATGVFGSLGSFFAKVGSKAKNVVKGGNKETRLATQQVADGRTAKQLTAPNMRKPVDDALKLQRLKATPKGEISAIDKAWMKTYEQSQRSLAAKAGRGISSNAGLMWGSSIAGGILMMVPFFVGLNKKKVAQDPEGAADDMFGLSDYIGADLAALAPMLISGLPVCLICCCCCFMMMMMMSMGGGASGNS